jgi:nucleotide-binding universal stress UspA family protein
MHRARIRVLTEAFGLAEAVVRPWPDGPRPARLGTTRGKGRVMTTPRGAVVVGVDEGPDSLLAVRWAAAEAERRTAPLHLVHSMSDGYREVPLTAGEYRRLHRRAARVIAGARAAVPDGCGRPISTAIVDAPAAPALVHASAEAALTVVGAHGHSVAFDLLVGSVSLHLAHHAASPVAVVREQADPAGRRIVVGVDGSADSDAALAFAFEAAAHEGLPVTALHGWAERFPPAGDIGEVGALSAVAPWAAEPRGGVTRIGEHEAILQAALAPWAVKYPEVVVETEVAAVHPSRLLVDASAHAHLVVVGACGQGFSGGMRLGSVGQAALHHAHCPVAIAR